MNAYLTKVILSLAVIAIAAPFGFTQQVVTGNLPATTEELKKIDVDQPLPTASGEEDLPSNCDNSAYLVVANQQMQGACSAFAVSYAISMLASFSKQQPVNVSPYFIWDIASYTNLFDNGSPLPTLEPGICSNWANEWKETTLPILNYRLKCRDCDCDVCKAIGISIPQALHESRKFEGIPLLQDYKKANCGKGEPNTKQLGLQTIRIKSSTVYISDRTRDELLPEQVVDRIKSLVAHKVPVVIASNVYFGMGYKGEVLDVENIGIEEGYHAMTIVGFDDNKSKSGQNIPSFKIINSWGSSWGDNGYLWVSREVLRRMVKEVYVVSLDSPDDNRIIDFGHSIGSMKFKLAYSPNINDHNVDLCLDANTYTENKPADFPNEVIAYQCHDGNNQIWELIYIQKPNRYRIRAYNGKFLTAIDDKVVLDVDKYSENAQWFLEKSADGARYIFKLSARNSNFVLGVDSVKADFYNRKNPPSIELNYDNGSVAQQWTGIFRVPKKD